MANKLILTVKGDRIGLDSLAKVLKDANELLGELDRTMNRGKTLSWSVGKVQQGSAIIEALPHVIKANTGDTSAAIISAFSEGIESLDSRNERPHGFSDRALELAKELTAVLSNGVSKVIVTGVLDDQALDAVTVTQRVAANVDEIIGEGYTSYGSIEGVLENLIGHNGYFHIYESVSNRRIRCDCTNEVLKELAELAFEKRVVVTGEITEDVRGRPKSVRVTKYRVLDRGDLPQIEDLLGIYTLGDSNNG